MTIEEGVEECVECVDGTARLCRSPPDLERHAVGHGRAFFYESSLTQSRAALDDDDAAGPGAGLLETSPDSIDLLVAAPQRGSAGPDIASTWLWPSHVARGRRWSRQLSRLGQNGSVLVHDVKFQSSSTSTPMARTAKDSAAACARHTSRRRVAVALPDQKGKIEGGPGGASRRIP